MSFQPYDSEIEVADKVLQVLARKKGTATNLEGFRKEAIDRFHRVGLVVDVKVYSTSESGTYAFDIELLDRVVSGGEFDHDRQVYEVTNDVLGLGTGGVIKSTKEDARRAIEVEKSHKCGTSCNEHHA